MTPHHGLSVKVPQGNTWEQLLLPPPLPPGGAQECPWFYNNKKKYELLY